MYKLLRRIWYFMKFLRRNCRIQHSKAGINRKFRDPRRVAIWSNVKLTNEQKKEIDRFYLENYGEKVPYTYHRHFTAFTGKFDVKYFPETMFIPEFESYMSLHTEYARAFSDKNMLPMLAYTADVRMPLSLYKCTKGIYMDANNQRVDCCQILENLRDAGEVFIKPTVDADSGQGCAVANFRDGIDTLSGKSCDEILSSMGRDFTVQERLKCHESIARIYDKSVNTFRIITYRWKDRFVSLPAVMRIGLGGNYLDNAHAGGMFIAIDEDGTLHKTAFTEFKKEYTVHPDSGLTFEGYRIPLFPKVVQAALRLHECIPQIGCVNWDLTIDESGEPILIEANMNDGCHGGSIWLLEMAHGCAPFGENTAEILRWLKAMKKVPEFQLQEYEFGYLPIK